MMVFEVLMDLTWYRRVGSLSMTFVWEWNGICNFGKHVFQKVGKAFVEYSTSTGLAPAG